MVDSSSDSPQDQGCADPEKEFERLKLLYDYTKFHIGVYATLVTLLIAMLSLYLEDLTTAPKRLLLATTVFFIFAGACGGMVASNIPNFSRISDFLCEDFIPSTFGNFGPQMNGSNWVEWEHRFFWFGIITAVVAIFVAVEGRI